MDMLGAACRTLFQTTGSGVFAGSGHADAAIAPHTQRTRINAEGTKLKIPDTRVESHDRDQAPPYRLPSLPAGTPVPPHDLPSTGRSEHDQVPRTPAPQRSMCTARSAASKYVSSTSTGRRMNRDRRRPTKPPDPVPSVATHLLFRLSQQLASPHAEVDTTRLRTSGMARRPAGWDSNHMADQQIRAFPGRCSPP